MERVATKDDEDGGVDLVMVADEVFPVPRSTSSLREQPVFAVSSAGQTTRLKFALRNVRQLSRLL
jgi:hypothetical protein